MRHSAAAFATYVTFSYSTTLTGGPHTITAVYSSTNPNIASSSDAKTQTIHKYSTLALFQFTASPTTDSAVSYAAILTGLGGVPIVGATITFKINGATLIGTTNDSA